jgi:hypothetical protein
VNSNQDSPAFWRSLYEAPVESSTGPESDSGRVSFDAADLIAEIADLPPESQGGAPNIDPAMLEDLVERLVKERLSAVVTSPLAAPVPVASQKRSPSTRPLRSEPPPVRAREADPTPPRREPQMPPPSPSSAPARGVQTPGSIPPVTRAAGSGHETLRPVTGSSPSLHPSRSRGSVGGDAARAPNQLPERSVVDVDPFASALGEAASPPEEAPSTEPEIDFGFSASDSPEPEIDYGSSAPDPEPDPEPELAADSAAIDKTSGYWMRIPVLKGGPDILMTSGLDPVAGLVLSMTDGVHSMKAIKALLPHVPDDTFLQIFRDALGKGLVEFK